MRRLITLPLLTLCLFLMAHASSSSRDSGVQMVGANQPGSLTGLGGVYILVESLDDRVEADGLKKLDLLDVVEDRLTKAGIPVVSKADHTPKTPVLYINVTAEGDRDDQAYNYSIQVKVEQNAYLQRSPKMLVIHATTWEQGTLGRVSCKAVETLAVQIEDLVDEFIKQYRQANPPKKAR